MAKAPGRTDRKTEVLNAAAGLFVANGYMSTTMDDIAAAVSLNKGTLYYYYDSKASILFDIINRAEQGRLEAARVSRGGEEGERRSLREFVEDTALYILDNPVSSRISAQESPFLDMWLNAEQLELLNKGHTEFQSHLTHFIQQALSGDDGSEHNVMVVAQVITGALTWLPRWYRAKGAMTKEEVAEEIANIILSGVLPRDGAARQGSTAGTEQKLVRKGKAAVAEQPRALRRERSSSRDKAQERRDRAAAVNRELG